MRSLGALVAAGALTCSAAASAAELPLRSGFYTLQGAPCEAASFADVLHVMPGRFERGKELCSIARLVPGQTSLMLTMGCEDRATGRKFTQSMPIRIRDREHFVYGRRPDALYRYCQLESMPEEWRTADELEPVYPARQPD